MFDNLTEETVKEFGKQMRSLSLWSGICTNCGKKYILGVSISQLPLSL